MHSEKTLKNDPLRVLSASKDGKNKITFEKFTCQPFIEYSPANIAIFLKD